MTSTTSTAKTRTNTEPQTTAWPAERRVMRPPEKTMIIISQNGIWTRARKEINGKTYDINIKRIREKGEDGIYIAPR